MSDASASIQRITFELGGAKNVASFNNPVMGDSGLRASDPNAQKFAILLALAEVYVTVQEHNFRSEALNCLDKAREMMTQGSIWLADVHTALAYVAEVDGFPERALSHYETALAVDSNYIAALVRLGALEAQRGNHIVAHAYLTAALRVDSTCHDAWYHMGVVQRHQGRTSEARDAFATALELERTCPVHCFSIVPRLV